MKDDLRGRLVTGLRRGAVAGALTGGITLVVLACSYMMIIRFLVATGWVPLHFAAMTPVAISWGWIGGTLFGALCGLCTGALQVWTRHWLPTVLVGAPTGFLVWWSASWLVLSLVFFRSPLYLDKIPTWAMIFGAAGVVPGVCTAIHGSRFAAKEQTRDKG